MLGKQFFRWLVTTRNGNVVLVAACGGLPFFLAFLPMLSRERGLTALSVFLLAAWSLGMWSFGGLLYWNAVTKPRLRQK